MTEFLRRAAPQHTYPACALQSVCCYCPSLCTMINFKPSQVDIHIMLHSSIHKISVCPAVPAPFHIELHPQQRTPFLAKNFKHPLKSKERQEDDRRRKRKTRDRLRENYNRKQEQKDSRKGRNPDSCRSIALHRIAVQPQRTTATTRCTAGRQDRS
ncbi:hypothetical protein BKA80DRAFT_104898 [Phyllosticta citrichinensis]